MVQSQPAGTIFIWHILRLAEGRVETVDAWPTQGPVAHRPAGKAGSFRFLDPEKRRAA
jgi:hypothetical protein